MAARSRLAVCSLLMAVTVPVAAEQERSVHAWNDYSFGLDAVHATAVGIAPDQPSKVWVGAGGSVYRSLDGGQSWDRLFVVRGIGVFADLDERREGYEADDLALQDAAEEIADEVRERVLDDLISEVGIELAEIIADDVVESMVEELIEDPDSDLSEGLDRRGLRERYGADPEDLDELERLLHERADWLQPDEEDRINRIDVAGGGRVLVSTSAGLLVTSDGGESFRRVIVGLGETGREVLAARWDRLESSRIYAGNADGLWVSEDEGLSFSRASGVVDRGEVRDIAVGPAGSNLVYAAAKRGLLRSDDGGITFSDVWAPVDEMTADARAVDLDGGRRKRVYAATAGGLLRSDDGGESFSLLDPPGLAAGDIRDVRAWPVREGALVVVTPTGVFASRDGAEHFHEAYPGLPAREVMRVAPVPGAFPEVFVATSTGVFRWEPVPDEPPRAEWVDEVTARAAPLPEIARAALEWVGIDSEWFQGSYRRAGRAWMLPRLDGVLAIVDQCSERHVVQEGLPTRRQIDLDDALRWEIRARWDLDAAIHDDSRVAVSRTWRTIRAERTRLLDRVAASYSAWVSLSVRAMQVGSRDLREAAFLAIQIAEAEAQLDALTGGFFTDSLGDT